MMGSTERKPGPEYDGRLAPTDCAQERSASLTVCTARSARPFEFGVYACVNLCCTPTRRTSSEKKRLRSRGSLSETKVSGMPVVG